MKVWLVRHAQPLIASGICYGATDMPAEPQATLRAAQALAQTLPSGLRMLSSPLQRCEQLAQCLTEQRPDLSYTTDARLAEMDFGCWEGQRWDAIPPADFDQWTAAFGTHRFGGKESVQEFMQRVADAWTEIQRRAQDTVWITHAGVIGAASLLSNGVVQVEQAAQWPQGGPAFGMWRELQA